MNLCHQFISWIMLCYFCVLSLSIVLLVEASEMCDCVWSCQLYCLTRYHQAVFVPTMIEKKEKLEIWKFCSTFEGWCLYAK